VCIIPLCEGYFFKTFIELQKMSLPYIKHTKKLTNELMTFGSGTQAQKMRTLIKMAKNGSSVGVHQLQMPTSKTADRVAVCQVWLSGQTVEGKLKKRYY
jgi:hypothetical protein